MIGGNFLNQAWVFLNELYDKHEILISLLHCLDLCALLHGLLFPFVYLFSDRFDLFVEHVMLLPVVFLFHLHFSDLFFLLVEHFGVFSEDILLFLVFLKLDLQCLL